MFWFRREMSSEQGRNAIKPSVYPTGETKQDLSNQPQAENKQLELYNPPSNNHTDIFGILPRCADEARRLDFQHFIVRSALGKNYCVPPAVLQRARMILDVGSGTNIWGHEICREFPAARVYGLDADYIMRPEIPKNYSFVRGNILHRFPFDKNTFHYVHQRFMGYAIPVREWFIVVDRLVMTTAPGGWIELLELGNEHARPIGPVTEQMTDNLRQLTTERGIDTRIVSSLDRVMEQAGMVNIRKKVVPLPVGKWGGRIGSLMATNLNAIMAEVRESCLQTFHYTPQYFDQLITTMNREWEEYHSCYPMYIYYGQKP